MGCCLGTSAASDYSDDYDNDRSFPLSHEQIKWKSKEPMTEAQLSSKRDEFWETAPAFEGRQEIWDALRASATHAEMGDFNFAQAIIDGANIYLPYGSLMESYDELGCRYVVPNFCLSRPTNLVDEDSSASRKSFAEEMQMEERKARGSHSSKSRRRCRCCPSMCCCSRRNSRATRKKLNGSRCRRHRTDRGGQCAYRPVLSLDECSHLTGVGTVVRLRLRVSSNAAEIQFDAGLKEPIGRLKWRLHYLYGESQSIPIPSHQRWLYGGKLLTDKLTVEQCRIAAQFVVQVVISTVVDDISSSKDLPQHNETDLNGQTSIEAAQIETAAQPDDFQLPSVSINIANRTGTVSFTSTGCNTASLPAKCTSAQHCDNFGQSGQPIEEESGRPVS